VSLPLILELTMDGAPVPVAVVTSRTEAELMVGFLRNHGLRAAVAADDAGGQEPQLQLQGVRVLVAADDEDAARRLLADLETSEPTTDP
jgi:Putative prokaryotic signal transducing protein